MLCSFCHFKLPHLFLFDSGAAHIENRGNLIVTGLYSLNRAENRLIKATLLKLMDKSESDRNRQSIRRLLASFEMVDPSVNYDADFARVSLDRNSKEYSLLMAWSRIFLYGKSFTTFAGSSKGVALLFPMELVYEQYVAAHVKKTFGNDGWDVSAQDKGY